MNIPYSWSLQNMELLLHLFHTLVGPTFLVFPPWEEIPSYLCVFGHLWALFLVFRGCKLFSSFHSYTVHWWSYFCASMIFMTLLDSLSHIFFHPWFFVTPFMHSCASCALHGSTHFFITPPHSANSGKGIFSLIHHSTNST